MNICDQKASNGMGMGMGMRENKANDKQKFGKVGNIASSEEIEGNTEAIEIFKSIVSSLDTESSTNLFSEFKQCNTPNQFKDLIRKIDAFNFILEKKHPTTSDGKKNLHRAYNSKLSNLRGKINNDSPLQKLLGYNEHLCLISNRVPTIRERTDHLSPYGDKVTGKFPLRMTNKDGKGCQTSFDKPEDLFDALMASLENSTWVNIVKIQADRLPSLGCVNILGSWYALEINIVGTDCVVMSNCPKIRHILCGGNPPKEKKSNEKKSQVKKINPNSYFISKDFKTMYPVYSKFLENLKFVIRRCVDKSYNDTECPYASIPCCRIQPPCSGETYCLKRIVGGSSRVYCVECDMELCTGGCGRVHHGETPCDMSSDEATSILIRESTKICPNAQCSSFITKTEGCNHMTCSQCHCEFCWLCQRELPRDVRGKYSTEMHFSQNSYGIGVNNGCSQF